MIEAVCWAGDARKHSYDVTVVHNITTGSCVSVRPDVQSHHDNNINLTQTTNQHEFKFAHFAWTVRMALLLVWAGAVQKTTKLKMVITINFVHQPCIFVLTTEKPPCCSMHLYLQQTEHNKRVQSTSLGDLSWSGHTLLPHTGIQESVALGPVTSQHNRLVSALSTCCKWGRFYSVPWVTTHTLHSLLLIWDLWFCTHPTASIFGYFDFLPSHHKYLNPCSWPWLKGVCHRNLYS